MSKIKFNSVLAAFTLIAFGILFQNAIANLLTYGWNDWPTHEADEHCSWVRQTFSQLSFFKQECPGVPYDFVENDKGTLVQTQETKYGYSFKLELFTRAGSETPQDVMKAWYAKLTPEQRKVCEIQSVDEPVTYFPDGKPNFHQRPNPTEHKTRYAIGIKSDVWQQITEKYGGDPGSSAGYDYMCGHEVGTTWGSYPPYFEFDDRSPEKYLLVGSYAFEAPPIDLNSIRF